MAATAAKTGASAGQSGTTSQTFNAEILDTHQIFNPGVSLTAFRLPGGQSFARGAFGFCGNANTTAYPMAKIDGAVDTLGSGTKGTNATGATIGSSNSAIIPIIGGKTLLEAAATGGSGSTADSRNWACWEAIDPTLGKAFIYKGRQTSNADGGKIEYERCLYDIGGWYKGGGKFVVPPGTTGRIRLHASFNNFSVISATYFHKNGSPAFAGNSLICNVGNAIINVMGISAILEVRPGDVLEVGGIPGQGAYTWANNVWNWFQIEEISAAVDYCLVRKIDGANGSNGYTTWGGRGAIVQDTTGLIYRPEVNTSRLYVPRGQGYKYARASFAVNSSVTGTGYNINYVQAVLNGVIQASQNGMPQQNTAQPGNNFRNTTSLGGWVPLDDTVDTQFILGQSTDGSGANHAPGHYTWFQLELRKY